MPSFKKFILTIGSPIEGAPYTPKVSLTGLLVCCPYSADFVAFYPKKYRFSINYFPQLLGSQKQTQPIQTDQTPFSSGHRLAKHVNFILTVHQKMVCWCIYRTQHQNHYEQRQPFSSLLYGNMDTSHLRTTPYQIAISLKARSDPLFPDSV